MKKQFLSLAIVAVSLATPAISSAAASTYATSVNGNTPYVYYRFNDAGGDETTAAAANGPAGTYNGTATTPAGGTLGYGTGSDNAVTFTGGTGTTSQYMASPIQGFGSLVGSSSYEFLFKRNATFPSTKQSLFGVFSPAAAPLDVEVTLNSLGNDNTADAPNTTRLYIKGQDGDGAGVHFVNPKLYDGEYHHLVFTFDQSGTGLGAFAAYVDGIAQTLTFSPVAATATDANADPDTFGKDFDFVPTFAARNVRGTADEGNGIQRVASVTLDEAALYGTVLTAEQVAAHATAAGFVVPEPATLAALAIGGFALAGRRRKA